MRTPFRILASLALAAALAAAAHAAQHAGVTMPDQLDVAGKPLVLNGMGLRKVAIIKVYVAGLYVPARSKDAAAILSGAGPRAIRMELVRDVDKGRLTNGFREGMAKNGGAKVAAHQANVDKFLASFGDVKKGAIILLADAAEGGLAVTIDGKERGIIGGREFADLVFAIWLGPRPPNEDLKKGLLGG